MCFLCFLVFLCALCVFNFWCVLCVWAKLPEIKLDDDDVTLSSLLSQPISAVDIFRSGAVIKAKLQLNSANRSLRHTQ